MQRNVAFHRLFDLNLPQHWVLVTCAATGLGAYAGLVMLHLEQGTLRGQHTPHTLGWYTIAFVSYLVALIWIETRRSASMVLILSTGLAFRLLLLVTVPTLSDDVYRYIWDGHLANHGKSPYALPIDSPELDYLEIPQRAQANNRWMASPYLPTAQFLFAGLTYLFPLQPLYVQLTMVLFDLLAALFLTKLLIIAGQLPYRVMIYFWNPLVIIEVAHGAHVDVLMVFLTLLSLWLTFSPRRSKVNGWLAPILLGLATVTKILPVLLLPVLFWRWNWRQLVLYGLVVLAMIAPFGLSAGWGLTGPLDGTGLFGAIRIYADQWNFNSGLFHWLEVDWLPRLGLVEATTWAKRITGLMMLLVLAGTWLVARQRAGILPTLRLMAVPSMAYLLLTTTVHPWYLLMLLAFLPFLPPRPTESPWRWLILAPWLYLSGTVALSYLTYVNPLDFREFEWIRNTEWVPTLILVLTWLVAGQLTRLVGLIRKS
jgi:hypothetical protein